MTHSQTHYQARLQRVIDYIYEHLDQPLDLNQLAEVACLSPYHWHRCYAGTMGETVFQTVKRLRLHRAASQLILSGDGMIVIAKRAGYANVPSFSRAFRQQYGLPPARYRAKGVATPFHAPSHNNNESKGKTMYDANIETLDAVHTVGIKHQGDYLNIGKHYETLYAIAGQKGLMANTDQPVRGFGVYFDDPMSVAEPELRSIACIATADNAAVKTANADCIEHTIPAGKYAKLSFKGPYNELGYAYGWLFSEWLPNSEYEPADSPAVEEYLNSPREVMASELLTNIYIPLK